VRAAPPTPPGLGVLLLLATLRHTGAGAGCVAHATGAGRADHTPDGLAAPRRARATWRPQLAAAALGGRQRLALASRDCRAPDPHATGDGEIILLVLSFESWDAHNLFD